MTTPMSIDEALREARHKRCVAHGCYAQRFNGDLLCKKHYDELIRRRAEEELIEHKKYLFKKNSNGKYGTLDIYVPYPEDVFVISAEELDLQIAKEKVRRKVEG